MSDVHNDEFTAAPSAMRDHFWDVSTSLAVSILIAGLAYAISTVHMPTGRVPMAAATVPIVTPFIPN